MEAHEADFAHLEAVLRAVQRTVSLPNAPSLLREDRRAWLAEAGFERRDLDAMAGLDERRLLLYRKLVRRGLRAAIRAEIPRTAARLGEAFDKYTTRYFDEALPSSPYLRDVAFEFITWISAPLAEDTSLPRYLIDLAWHELRDFEVACDPREDEAPTGLPLELDRGVRFRAAAMVAWYNHAIHRLNADLDARDEPPRVRTALFVYRDAEYEIRYLELTPVAATIVDLLMAGETLRSAVVRACEEHGNPVDGAVLEGTARVLSDLGERGVLLGGAPDPAIATSAESADTLSRSGHPR